MEIEPERYGWTVEGPFLHPDSHDSAICYLAEFNVLESHRGSGVYPFLVSQMEQLSFPVYACFTSTPASSPPSASGVRSAGRRRSRRRGGATVRARSHSARAFSAPNPTCRAR